MKSLNKNIAIATIAAVFTSSSLMAQENTCQESAQALDETFDKYALESQKLEADFLPKLEALSSAINSIPKTNVAEINRVFRDGLRDMNLPADKIFATALMATDTGINAACIQNIALHDITRGALDEDRYAVELNLTLCASPEIKTHSYHGGIVKYHVKNGMSAIETVRAEDRSIKFFDSATPELKEGLQKVLKLQCH